MQITNSYHSKIISALEEVCEKNPRISKYDKPQIKLNCCKKNCDCVLRYEPDFCMSYRPSRYSEQLIIFEIIDAQDEPTTIADLIRIKLSDHCRKAFFIYPDETKEKMVRMVLCTVLSNFKRLFGEPFDI